MGFIRDLTGKTQVQAATKAGELQRETAFGAAEDVGAAGAQAGELLQPFQDVGQRGVDLAGFLGDPNQQFQFLQQNPLFQRALQNANVQTQRVGASRGRLSAGDTLEQLAANTLQTARPFLQDQRSDILNLLNLGRGVASERGGILQGTAADVANLQTSGTAAQAAGIVGAANARGQRAGNILDIGTQVVGAFSDVRLKENIKEIGLKNGHKTYSWDWNSLALKLFRLKGGSFGVIAQEVNSIMPKAITFIGGYMMVNYEMIGVNHGG